MEKHKLDDELPDCYPRVKYQYTLSEVAFLALQLELLGNLIKHFKSHLSLFELKNDFVFIRSSIVRMENSKFYEFFVIEKFPYITLVKV